MKTERLTREEIKKKVLAGDCSHSYDTLKTYGFCSPTEAQIDALLTEAYNQGTLCQNSSHGNRVGHFEEWNK